MNIKGKVTELFATTQVTEKVKKREIVVEYAENPQYQEYIKLEAINDRCSLLDNIQVGDEVEIEFNLRGRPWVDKTGKKVYFNTLAIWKVTKLGGYVTTVITAAKDDGDDLPF